MKFAVFMVILSSITLTGAAIAAEAEIEAENKNDDYAAYCNEQAELAGIEDAGEKSQYINECIDSFALPAEGAPQQD